MTSLRDLPYELRLCTELLHYAGIACPKTQNMTASEIKAAAAVFFDASVIDEATRVLCGTSNVEYSGE